MSYNWWPKYISVTLGKEYRVHGAGLGPFGRVGKLIKVTSKGFNLLDESNNICLLKHHLYCKEWSRKQVPFTIPNKFTLTYNGKFFDIKPKGQK